MPEGHAFGIADAEPDTLVVPEIELGEIAFQVGGKFFSSFEKFRFKSVFGSFLFEGFARD